MMTLFHTSRIKHGRAWRISTQRMSAQRTGALAHRHSPALVMLMTMAASAVLFLGVLLIPTSARAVPESFAPLVKKLLPSVVNIRSEVLAEQADQPQGNSGQGLPRGFEEFFRQFNLPLPNQPPQQNLPSTSMGSGFIIDARGLVVTNNHVIEGADVIHITMQDGDDFVASLVGTDPKTDLALLRFDPMGKQLSAVEFGDSNQSEVGDWVLAIGNPLGRLGGSVSAGIISARGRDINVGPYDDFIQTDAAINRGNSGGPLFNTRGEVIGINTIIFSPTGGSIGIGFSVPSNLAKNVIAQLDEFGTTRRGWLGVLIQDISPEIAESLGLDDTTGALVSQITPGGPAAEAGFEVGDLIVVFDGKEVESSNELPILVAETPVGKRVDVEVIRGGDSITLPVSLGQLETAEKTRLAGRGNQPQAPLPSAEPEFVLGMTLSVVSDVLRQKYALDSDAEGMVITGLQADSEAVTLGLNVGDLLVRINQTAVNSLNDVNAALDSARQKGRKNVLLYLRSNGSARFVALPLDE